jgi:hypothetical protein
MESSLAGMTEWGMSDVVREAGSFHQVRIDPESFFEQGRGLIEPMTNASPDLGDLDGVSQPGSVEIIFPGKEDLRLVLKTTERRGVNDAIAIDLERTAIVAGHNSWSALASLRIKLLVESILHS